jgi:DNA-binding protein Fis
MLKRILASFTSVIQCRLDRQNKQRLVDDLKFKLAVAAKRYESSLGKESAYKDFMIEIDIAVVDYSMLVAGGSITKASQIMGLANRSTLYSMLNRLESQRVVIKS